MWGGEEVEQGRRKEKVENEVSTVQSKEEKKKEARERGARGNGALPP